MTLDVICDVTIAGDNASLELLRASLKELFEESISTSGLASEGFEVLKDSPDLIQVFFTTRYQAPVLAVKNIADKYQGMIFTLTFDDQIGNAGRIQFRDGEETKLAYESEFHLNLNRLVSEGELPPYGIIATGKDEDDLNSIVLRYAQEKGFEPEGDEEEAWVALDWLVEEVGQDFGSFEMEGLNFIFRPWAANEF
ncbi:MAG: hypothetical protein RL228_1142 [Actinomycetota bacterium]|jgi:hypothetical protein